MEEWYKQRAIQKDKKKASLLDLGFSTIFLNRVNMSGIINAGPIGGKQQTGNYKMDCRFNKSAIIERIKKIASRKKDIRLYNKDAIKLIDKIEKEAAAAAAEDKKNIIFYFDPPYYLKANSLYMNHYKNDNHKEVSDRIQNIENIQWVVSYDNVPEINEIYPNCPKKEYSFKHTAYKARLGQEILFFSGSLKQPEIENWNPLNFKFDRKQESIAVVYKG